MTSVSTPSVPSSTLLVDDKPKKSSAAPAIIAVLIVLIMLFVAPYLLGSLVHNTQVKKAETTKSNQLSYIQLFVDDHNDKSSYKISNLKRIDLSNETGEYYRKTNTYGNDGALVMHGYIDKSDIWIISCSADVSTQMRIYAESTDYALLTDLVHTSISYLNPHSTDNNERLGRFDSMIQNSQYGLYIENINGTGHILF